VEDVVFVVDAGRAKTTFVNEATLVSALRTTWYAKASGLQRRGRAGRCRPGAWYRLYSSMQWDAMADYQPPEMVTLTLSRSRSLRRSLTLTLTLTLA
jgi:HrpA-like RNA helicase